ncbi:MAG: AAA family ATPase [Planctomycetaceae bacterium]|jgi:chromosomal replication initiator protein|nr:AAA family ATPase [Planctomycetaceae bacterium]
MENSIHVIPFSGKLLEFDISGGGFVAADGRVRGRARVASGLRAKRPPKEQQLYSQPKTPNISNNLLLRVSDNGFMVGEENYAIERVVSDLLGGLMPRERLPVLFYGQSGTGKTHLLQGILESRRKLSTKRPKDVLINAADFARFFTEAIDLKATDDFRRRFREVTMLLVDDVERIEGRNVVLEEFQNTLDTLVSCNVPVILTSRALPKFPQPLSDRIISGTTIPIMLPGIAVREHFIRSLLSAFRVSISESAVLLATRELAMPIPAIYGAIAGMICKAMSENVKVDTCYFKQFLKNRNETARPSTSIERIVKSVAGYFSFKAADLKGESRKKTVAMARALAVYLTRRETNLTLKQIAKFFGNRDQSTIRHLIEKIELAQKNDTTIKSQLITLMEMSCK